MPRGRHPCELAASVARVLLRRAESVVGQTTRKALRPEPATEASFAARTTQDGVAPAHDFAIAIDSSKPYLVLLTPEGDASLFVASRTAAGFEVRQTGGGHSSVTFAYRIVAKPYGVSDERLPFKTTSVPISPPGH